MKRIINILLLLLLSVNIALGADLFANRVAETTRTTGTGTINLDGAKTGYKTFVSGIGDGNTCKYLIINAAGQWEMGSGTVTDAATDTLSRTTVESSSNADAAVNFSSGLKTVYCVLSAEQVSSFMAGTVTLNASAITGGMSIAGQEISNRAATNAQTGYATPAQISAVDNLITLSGVAEGATNLGIFTGSIIDDNQTNKQALQLLETEIESLAGGHDAVTLDVNADTILSLSTQELGLDTQNANKVFAGPVSGGDAVPTVRSLVADDIPDLSGTYITVGSSIDPDNLEGDTVDDNKVDVAIIPTGAVADEAATLATGDQIRDYVVGLGYGDVSGPSEVVNGNFAGFDGTSGKLLEDSGYGPNDFATAAQGSLADTALQSEVDGSITNENNTFTGDNAVTTTAFALQLLGGGIVSTAVSGSEFINNIITITATEVDGSTSNEINTFTADDAGTTTGLAVTLAGAGTVATTRSGDTITFTGTGDGTGTDDQTASEVSVTDTEEDFTGETVEAVLHELQDNIDGVGGGHDAVTLNASATTAGLSLNTQELSYQAATNAQNGYMTAAMVQAVETNTSKETNTDDQTIDVLSLDGTTLNISLEGDGEENQTVDLSGLQDGTGTDDQTATEVSVTTTAFGGILANDNTSDTVQECLDLIDDHVHTGATISGIDISDDTNLAGTANEIVLTGDTLSLHADIARDTELHAANAVNTTYDANSDSVIDTAAACSGNAATATTAGAGDSATGFFSSGTIEHEYGGFEADVSAYDGMIKISGGATSNIKCTYNESDAPDANDDIDGGWSIGSKWYDTTADKEYTCLDTTDGAAVWSEGGGGVEISSGRISGLNIYKDWTILYPNATYSADPEIIIIAKVPADLTITLFHADIKEDTTTEIEIDLYYVTDPSDMTTGKTLIGAVDITNGQSGDVTSFTDATIPAGNCIIMIINTEPLLETNQVACSLVYDFD